MIKYLLRFYELTDEILRWRSMSQKIKTKPLMHRNICKAIQIDKISRIVGA